MSTHSASLPAATPSASVTLGEVLIRRGLIDSDQLAGALEYQQEEAENLNWFLLGEIFVRWGLVTHEELMAAIDEQYVLNEQRRFEKNPHPSTGSLLKRGVDIVGALVGLMLTGLVLPAVGLALYLEDRGPLFFSQPRVGLRGKQFTIWKFRSMMPDADKRKLAIAGYSYAFFNVPNDTRITRVGSILRRTMIDEFPQFWNILRGEMSLVGTRPPTLDEVKHYNSNQWRRLAVKPGMTGLWQATGSRHDKSFDEVVALDIEYQNRWSVGFDLLLIARTVYYALFRRGKL